MIFLEIPKISLWYDINPNEWYYIYNIDQVKMNSNQIIFSQLFLAVLPPRFFPSLFYSWSPGIVHWMVDFYSHIHTRTISLSHVGIQVILVPESCRTMFAFKSFNRMHYFYMGKKKRVILRDLISLFTFDGVFYMFCNKVHLNGLPWSKFSYTHISIKSFISMKFYHMAGKIFSFRSTEFTSNTFILSDFISTILIM